MKILAVTVLVGTALSGLAVQAEPNFQLSDKITAAQPLAADVAKAVSDELNAYPEHSLAILKAALNKVTPEWTADDVTSVLKTAFSNMPVEQIHLLIPEVKTLVASYQEQLGETVVNQVLGNLNQLATPVANIVQQQRAAAAGQTRQEVPVSPVVVPATPDDVSTN